MKLCSACLLGINCKYDGKNRLNAKLVDLAKKDTLIPICPEQLGGLSTPREPAETTGDGSQVFIKKARVVTKSGAEVTVNFINGAREVLKIVKLFHIKEAILKQRSPSCGCGQIYDGTFSGKVITGYGVTAALLKNNGVKLISEEEL